MGTTAGAGRRRRRARPRGGFEGLITSAQSGRVRGLHWTQTAIQQLYMDKSVQDAVCDREGTPRLGLCEFVLAWHMQR